MHQPRMNVVTISADETDPREPTSRCDRCGKVGNIARATCHSKPLLVLRYCADCWPTVEKELEILQQEEQRQWRLSSRARPSSLENVAPPPAWTTSSRSWHDVLRFLDLIGQSPRDGRAPSNEDLALVASDIRAKAGEMSGVMPREVEDFLTRYSPPAV